MGGGGGQAGPLAGLTSARTGWPSGQTSHGCRPGQASGRAEPIWPGSAPSPPLLRTSPPAEFVTTSPPDAVGQGIWVGTRQGDNNPGLRVHCGERGPAQRVQEHEDALRCQGRAPPREPDVGVQVPRSWGRRFLFDDVFIACPPARPPAGLPVSPSACRLACLSGTQAVRPSAQRSACLPISPSRLSACGVHLAVSQPESSGENRRINFVLLTPAASAGATGRLASASSSRFRGTSTGGTSGRSCTAGHHRSCRGGTSGRRWPCSWPDPAT